MSKPMKDSKGREVVDVEFEGGDDAYFTAGTYKDDGAPVPDDELEWLTKNYCEELAFRAFEAAVGRAEAFYEGDR